MRTFVINLEESEIRRREAERQLNAAGVKFEIFRAIGKEHAQHHFAAYDEIDCILNTGRSMTDGEFGCFASHRALWQIGADNDEALLIFEDDLLLQGGFAEAVAVVERNIDKFGFVRLQTDLREGKRRVKKIGPFQLSRFTQAPHGMLCYAISAAVARDWLRKTNSVDAPVDVFVKKFWEHQQPIFALTPYTVKPSSLSQDTTIPGRVKHRKPFHLAARRFLRKCGWYIRRHWYNRTLTRIWDPS